MTTSIKYLNEAANDLSGAKMSIENAIEFDKSDEISQIYSRIDSAYDDLESYISEKEKNAR